MAKSEQKKEDMLKLIIEQNIQLKKMEERIEELLKEKETLQLSMVPITAVPIAVAGTKPSSSSTSIESTSTAVDPARLAQELSIQKQENQKLLQKFQNLELQKVQNDTLYLQEMQKTHKLELKIQKLESESLMANTLAHAKEIIWTKTSQSMIEIWPSIQIIFQQQELIIRCRALIEEQKAALKTKPTEATYMIKVLNSKTKEELEEINISDRIATIIEIKKVLQKRNLINQLETKCQTLDISVKRSHSKFNVLNQKGLRGLLGLNNKFIRLYYYCKGLYVVAVDITKFVGVK